MSMWTAGTVVMTCFLAETVHQQARWPIRYTKAVLLQSECVVLLVQMSMWTAGIVVMTLLVNAPLIPVLLKWTGLSQVSPVKAKIRAKAARAFTRYTQNAVKELKNDEDEMLRGELKPELGFSLRL